MNSGIINPHSQGALCWMYSFCIQRGPVQQINGPLPELNALKKGGPACLSPISLHETLAGGCQQGFCCLVRQSNVSAAPRTLSRHKRSDQPGLCHPRLLQPTAGWTVEEAPEELKEGQNSILHKTIQQTCCLHTEHQVKIAQICDNDKMCSVFQGGQWCNPAQKNHELGKSWFSMLLFLLWPLARPHLSAAPIVRLQAQSS